MTPSANGPRTLLALDPTDDIAVAMRNLQPGEMVVAPAGVVAIAENVPAGHKVALRNLAAGDPIHKYGQTIGVATTPIRAGAHVHSHNLGYVEERSGYEIATSHADLPATESGRTFEGFHRDDGPLGTRNHIGILASVNCSASTAKMIAEQVKPSLAAFPDVDGVVALTRGMIPASVGARCCSGRCTATRLSPISVAC